MKGQIIFALVVESVTVALSLAFLIIGIVTSVGGINSSITIPAFVLGSFLLVLSGSALTVEIIRIRKKKTENSNEETSSDQG